MESIRTEVLPQNITGYDISQVSYDSSMVDLFKCLFCEKICENPTYIECCHSLACHKCFKQVSKSNLICEKCGNYLRNKDPEAIVLGLLEALRVKCDYDCGSECGFKEIKDHEKYCTLNPDALFKCQTCELDFAKLDFQVHNCTKSLKKNFERLKNEMSKLKLDNSYDLLGKMKHSLRLHEHPLTVCKRKNAWRCNFCRDKYYTGDESYYCYDCDFDCCAACFNGTYGKEEDKSLHQHELKLNTVENPFECSKCNNPYRSGSTMWKCFQCNFEICIKCRYI